MFGLGSRSRGLPRGRSTLKFAFPGEQDKAALRVRGKPARSVTGWAISRANGQSRLIQNIKRTLVWPGQSRPVKNLTPDYPPPRKGRSALSPGGLIMRCLPLDRSPTAHLQATPSKSYHIPVRNSHSYGFAVLHTVRICAPRWTARGAARLRRCRSLTPPFQPWILRSEGSHGAVAIHPIPPLHLNIILPELAAIY